MSPPQPAILSRPGCSPVKMTHLHLTALLLPLIPLLSQAISRELTMPQLHQLVCKTLRDNEDMKLYLTNFATTETEEELSAYEVLSNAIALCMLVLSPSSHVTVVPSRLPTARQVRAWRYNVQQLMLELLETLQALVDRAVALGMDPEELLAGPAESEGAEEMEVDEGEGQGQLQSSGTAGGAAKGSAELLLDSGMRATVKRQCMQLTELMSALKLRSSSHGATGRGSMHGPGRAQGPGHGSGPGASAGGDSSSMGPVGTAADAAALHGPEETQGRQGHVAGIVGKINQRGMISLLQEVVPEQASGTPEQAPVSLSEDAVRFRDRLQFWQAESAKAAEAGKAQQAAETTAQQPVVPASVSTDPDMCDEDDEGQGAAEDGEREALIGQACQLGVSMLQNCANYIKPQRGASTSNMLQPVDAMLDRLCSGLCSALSSPAQSVHGPGQGSQSMVSGFAVVRSTAAGSKPVWTPVGSSDGSAPPLGSTGMACQVHTGACMPNRATVSPVASAFSAAGIGASGTAPSAAAARAAPQGLGTGQAFEGGPPTTTGAPPSPLAFFHQSVRGGMSGTPPCAAGAGTASQQGLGGLALPDINAGAGTADELQDSRGIRSARSARKRWEQVGVACLCHVMPCLI